MVSHEVQLIFELYLYNVIYLRGYGGTVVTHSFPTSEVGGSKHEPYVGRMVVFTDGGQLKVQNLDQLCLLVSSALKTLLYDMTYTV